MGNQFEINRVKINIEYKDERVYGIETELEQVILNILNNAIDAHNEAKSPNPFITLDTLIEKETITISIHDNAGGIVKEHLSRLFEPYFSTKGKNGTGLGLYMSKMIVEKQFGGEIVVQTSGGETTFSVKIPISLKN